tara:strand:+ start:840 stop:1466 length:627 start_codon:yes stop_codon:yes gene_type:complete
MDTKIYGIDISHYQDNKGRINWKKVSQNTNPKITFAYIRTTMGKDGIDKAFQYNFKEAQKNGIKVGVYHYYRPNENSLEQFENFLKNTPEVGDLPPVLDIEEKSKFGPKNLRQGIDNFLKLVERKYQQKAIIYAHQRFYNTYLRNKFSQHEIWIARQNGFKTKPENNEMKKEPFLFDGRCPLIWQYSGTGTIDGIHGYVDLNIMRTLN